MAELPIPHRRYRLVLDLQADTLDEIGVALRSIDFSVTAEGSTRCTSGGVASGWNYDVTEDPTMTHERYVEELNAWLRASRAQGGRSDA